MVIIRHHWRQKGCIAFDCVCRLQEAYELHMHVDESSPEGD